MRRLHLLYHELRPEKSDYSYVLQTRKFEEQLEFFLRLQSCACSELIPELTFDDGHISNCEQALPALQARRMKAHFFITVGWTGKKTGFMGWSELRQLHASGQSIGAHGWSHTLLTHCGREQLHTELQDARKALEDGLGAPIKTMSLPGGRYNKRVMEACGEAGYEQVYTSIPRAESSLTSPTIGRLNIRGDMDLSWIESLFEPGSRLLAKLERQYEMKATAKALLGDRLYSRLWAFMNRHEPETGGDELAANEHTAHHQ